MISTILVTSTFVLFALQQYYLFSWMRTMSDWQKSQDKMIVDLAHRCLGEGTKDD